MSQKPTHILLVEDTDSVRIVLTRQLSVMGADVEDVPSAELALERAKNGSFDLILTDLRMPEADGWSVITEIRKINGYQTTPIVLMTADPIHLSQLPDPFCFYVQKPIAMDTLTAILNGRLDSLQTSHHQGQMICGDTAIDKAALRVQMGQLDDDAIAMVKLFPQMMHPLLHKVLACAAEKDYAKLEEAAHSLKGAAWSVGALILGDICANIQRHAAQNEITEKFLDDVQREFLRVEKEIQDL